MQSLLRFKIDTLISLARITEDSESKQRYIDEIESLLIQCETSDTQYAHDIHDTAHLFTEQKAESEIVDKTVREVYQEYCTFCDDEGWSKLTIQGFGRVMKEAGYHASVRNKAKTYIRRNFR